MIPEIGPSKCPHTENVQISTANKIERCAATREKLCVWGLPTSSYLTIFTAKHRKRVCVVGADFFYADG